MRNIYGKTLENTGISAIILRHSSIYNNNKYIYIYIILYYIHTLYRHIVLDGTHIYQNRSFQTPMIFEQVTAAMPAEATSPAAAAAFL